MKDVAAHAGVSVATVSAVVNGRPDSTARVGDEARRRVMDSIAELGYVPDPVARSLAGGSNRIIGIFAYEGPFPIERRSFYQPFLVGIEEVAQTERHDVLLHTGTMTLDGRRSIYGEGTNRLRLSDGAIILGSQTDAQELRRLADEGYPFVHVGRREVPGVEIPFVAPDYRGAARNVVRHLLERGHSTLAYLGHARELGPTGDALREPILDRQAGFEDGLRDGAAGVRGGRHAVDPDRGDGTAVRAALRNATALVAESAEVARHVLAVARSDGAEAPADFALAVLGDPADPSDPLPDWTMVRIPRRAIGRHAAEELLATLSEPRRPPIQRFVPCEFHVGRTTQGPSHAAESASGT